MGRNLDLFSEVNVTVSYLNKGAKDMEMDCFLWCSGLGRTPLDEQAANFTSPDLEEVLDTYVSTHKLTSK